MTSTLIMIVIWGWFLILTSAGISSLQEKMARNFEETRRLYEELKRIMCRRRNEGKGVTDVIHHYGSGRGKTRYGRKAPD